jgi:hypothetical protein
MKLVLRWIAPLVAAIMLSGPAFAASGLPAPARTVQTAPAAREVAAGTVATTTADTQSYAAREKQAVGLENWQGGAAGASIYLGGSALALALLLVILLVLL